MILCKHCAVEIVRVNVSGPFADVDGKRWIHKTNGRLDCPGRTDTCAEPKE